MNYILTDTSFTGVYLNKTITCSSASKYWAALVQAVKAQEWDDVIDLCDLATQINHITQGKITIKEGVLYYGDRQLHNSLVDRILRMKAEGFDIAPMVSFLDNLMDNPSARSVQDLYRFMKHNSLPITNDGYFLAYKRVKADYTDVHSGTFSNRPGSTCEMPRNEVQDNPDVTCSAGLHFCSMSYLSKFWGDRVVILKINPADVVSIPTDYNNAKGRCSKYYVLGEHTDGLTEDTLSSRAVYVEVSGPYRFYNVRDSKGRFTKG